MTTTTNTTADDIEDALSIIAENGGTGEWENSQSTMKPKVERWLFPRFKGADGIGTCDLDTEDHKDIHECSEHEDEESFAVDMGNMYLSRTGIGYDSDVETVIGWLDAPRNVVGAVNLLSEPGTGKTALVEAAATHSDRELLTWLCTPDDTRDSLFLRFVGEGKGDCLNHGHEEGMTCASGCIYGAFTLGPIPFAAKYGRLLYLDEWMMLVDGVKPILYSLTDGRHMLPGGNLDGSPMVIHPDFRMILSSNPLVRGSSMPEPMASRTASTTLTVETSAPMLRDLGIDESVVAAWETLGTSNLWRPAIRELRLADYWLGHNATQAVSAFLPEHCPETQRKQVRDIVQGMLGGSIRADGRLVVS